jgi:hypothetical protein
VGRGDSLRILLVGNAWGREWTQLGTTLHKWGPLVGSRTANISGETSVGTCKLVETTEMPYSDVLAHTSEVCKGIPSDQRMPGCKTFAS